MTGGTGGVQLPGRFRSDRSTWKVVGDWSWYENGFANTRAFKGLVVANLMMNNWVWKTSNNEIYEIRDRDSRESRRIYRSGPGCIPWPDLVPQIARLVS